jgi:signal transduction histidine kinase
MVVASTMSIWRRPGGTFGRILLIAGILLIIPFAAYYHGGLVAPVMPLTMIVPLLAFFLLGRKFAIAVLVLNLVMYVSIYLLRLSDIIPEVIVDSLQRERTRMLIFSAIAIFAFAIGCIYEVYRKRMQAFEILLAEQDAIKTIVTTYNHEINNPLAIALGHLEILTLKGDSEPESLKSLHSSLLRIKDVSRKIDQLSETADRQKEVLYGETKMFKLF